MDRGIPTVIPPREKIVRMGEIRMQFEKLVTAVLRVRA